MIKFSSSSLNFAVEINNQAIKFVIQCWRLLMFYPNDERLRLKYSFIFQLDSIFYWLSFFWFKNFNDDANANAARFLGIDLF